MQITAFVQYAVRYICIHFVYLVFNIFQFLNALTGLLKVSLIFIFRITCLLNNYCKYTSFGFDGV